MEEGYAVCVEMIDSGRDARRRDGWNSGVSLPSPINTIAGISSIRGCNPDGIGDGARGRDDLGLVVWHVGWLGL